MIKKLILILAILPTLAFAQQNLSQGGTGWNTSTKGDLLVGTSSVLRYTRLPIGATGTVLWSNLGQPAWIATSSLGFPDLLSLDSTFSGQNTFSATTTFNKIKAGTSAGLDIFSNSGSQIVNLGAGGGTSADFKGAGAFASYLRVGGSSHADSMFESKASTNDGSTGIIHGYDSSSNELFSLQSNGNLGLSTTSPSEKLHVVGNFRLTGAIRDSINASGTSGQILTSTGTSTLWSTIASYLTQNFAVASSTGFTTGNLFATSTATISGRANFSSTTAFTGTRNDFNVSSTSVATIGNLFATGTSIFATSTVNGSLTMNGPFINRTVGYSSNASTTVSCDTTDQATTTIFATTTIVNFSGTCYDGQMVELTLMATTSWGLYWGTNFGSSTDLSLPSSMASGTMEVLVQFDKFRNKWWLLGLLKSFNN